ncbi:hypothetical protein [Halosegnis marinus]
MTWHATATVSGRVEAFAGALRPLVESVAERFFERLDERFTAA